MSGAVYGGLSQVVGLQSWPNEFTLGALFALMLATFAVNLRFFLISLTFRPWLGALPAWQVYPTLAFITDANWLRAMRYRDEGGNDVSFFLGGGILLWSRGGHHRHRLRVLRVADQSQGLRHRPVDPVLLCCALIPAWRGARRALPWLVAGLVAVAVNWFITGYWYIVAGSIAGALAAGVLDD